MKQYRAIVYYIEREGDSERIESWEGYDYFETDLDLERWVEREAHKGDWIIQEHKNFEEHAGNSYEHIEHSMTLVIEAPCNFTPDDHDWEEVYVVDDFQHLAARLTKEVFASRKGQYVGRQKGFIGS